MLGRVDLEKRAMDLGTEGTDKVGLGRAGIHFYLLLIWDRGLFEIIYRWIIIDGQELMWET